VFLVAGLNPGAFVGDLDDDLSSPGFMSGRVPKPSASIHGLDSVVEHIDEDMLELLAVDHDRGLLFIQLRDELNVAMCALIQEDHVPQDRMQGLPFHYAGGHTREV